MLIIGETSKFITSYVLGVLIIIALLYYFYK